MTLSNLVPAIPEIFVLVMICVTLMAGVFVKCRHICYLLAQFTVVVAGLLVWFVYVRVDHSALTFAFNGTFVLDHFAVILNISLLIMALMSFWFAFQYNEQRDIPNNEFYVLALLSVLGMMVLVSAHNLLTIYLGIELMSLPIYAMVALRRKDERCIEAGMKYFVMGALASGLLLYGVSMIFGATKSLDLIKIAQVIQTTSASHDLILVFGLIFIIAGMAFKLGAAPFHMWVPDVYDGAPSSVTLFLSSAPKIAAFGLMVRLLVEGMPALHLQWQPILIVTAILSIGIGNLVAIVQTNIKRMLGYSSIAHMGYMLLGLACVTERGYAAAMFYMISYAIMTLGAFGLVIMMSRAGFEADQIDDYAGLNSRNPWLAFVMLLVMFSMAGIPPIVGFIAKVGILEALINAHLVWLAVVALIFAIIGAYYYIRVVKVMYFEKPTETQAVVCPGNLNTAITISGLAVLVLGIFPGFLFAICHIVF